jgi:hypothetical protein
MLLDVFRIHARARRGWYDNRPAAGAPSTEAEVTTKASE